MVSFNIAHLYHPTAHLYVNRVMFFQILATVSNSLIIKGIGVGLYSCVTYDLHCTLDYNLPNI